MSSVRKFKENEEEFFYLKIRSKDAILFLNKTWSIERQLSNNPSVLNEFKTLMDLFKSKDEDNENYYSQIIEGISKNIISWLTKPRMKYKFSIEIEDNTIDEDIPKEFIGKHKGNKTKNKEIKKKKILLSLEDMIKYPLFTAFECFEKGTDKELCITNCYKMIDDYTQRHKKIRELYSHYKISIVAGYIAWIFGFEISKELSPAILENRQPTADRVFGAVNYCTEPYMTYEKNKKRK